jgi:predicted ABC-type ATPase
MADINPEALVIGGPNGAGKTTFVREYLTEYSVHYLAADRIAEEINPDDPESVDIKAGREFLERIRQQIQTGNSFIVETTLSGKTFHKFYQQMTEKGYHITTFFLYLNSAEQHVQRVKARTGKGGHHVPENDVRRRYIRSIQNFWNIYRSVSMTWTIINSSVGSYIEIARGSYSEYNIIEEDKFEQLLNMVDNG